MLAPMAMGGDLVREARRRAALTQHELAARAGTTQSAVARWESGRVEPGFETVRRLLRLCGFALLVALEPSDDSDLHQARQLLEMTPSARVDQVARTAAFVAALREAPVGTVDA